CHGDVAMTRYQYDGQVVVHRHCGESSDKPSVHGAIVIRSGRHVNDPLSPDHSKLLRLKAGQKLTRVFGPEVWGIGTSAASVGRDRSSKYLMKRYIEGEKDEHLLTVEGLSYLQNLYREIDSRS